MKRSAKFYSASGSEPLPLMRQAVMDEVTKVASHLYMGSHLAAGNEDFLRSQGVTHVLSIGHRPTKTFSQVKYTFFDIRDEPGEDIKSIFKECSQIIEQEKNAGGVVYVHCYCGVSRSPAVVIAHLMITERIGYDDALARVRQVRVLVQPNQGFVTQLKILEEQLKIMDVT